MKNLVPKIGIAALIVLVAACGNGRSDRAGDSADPKPADGSGYVSLLQEQKSFFRRYSSSSLEPIDAAIKRNTTDRARMPTGGTAQYTGVGSVTFPDTDAGAAGRAKLTANFSNGNLSGRVDDFKAQPGNTAGGSVDVDANILGSAAVGNVNGSISLNGQNYKIDQPVAGVFLGRDADSLGLGSPDDASGIGMLITADRM